MRVIKFYVLLGVLLICNSYFALAVPPSHPAGQIIVQTGASTTDTLQNLFNSNQLGGQWSGAVPGDIYYTGGNVGIGTNNPIRKFQISGNTYPSGEVQLALIQAIDSSAAGIVAGYRADGQFSTRGFLRSTGGKPLDLGTTSNLQAFSILDNGNVGIGTTNPLAKLTIWQTSNVVGSGLSLRDASTSWDAFIGGNDELTFFNGINWAAYLGTDGTLSVKKDVCIDGTGTCLSNSLGSFVAATGQTYTGSTVGGYAGGNDKCDDAWTGSRMCTSADFANRVPDAEGWYSTFIDRDNDGLYSGDCDGWTSNLASLYGNYWNYDNINDKWGSSTLSCELPAPILCCR